MGVYFTGMEMPIEKSRIIQIYPDGSVRRLDGGVLNSHFNAIPVPPHGDLIDIHALIDGIFCELESAYKQGDTEEYEYWVRVLEFARKAPTIIPADSAEEGER